MTKSFMLILIFCLVALSVFTYFIFGFNQTTSSLKDQAISSPKDQTQALLPSSTPVATGLKIEDIKVGTGQEVKNGDTVIINYLGTLADGTKFDSSYDRGQPFETQIGVGQVIKGWDLGVVGMKIGGKRRLTIPPSLGYGDQQAGSIPPNSTLIFEVELVGVK